MDRLWWLLTAALLCAGCSDGDLPSPGQGSAPDLGALLAPDDAGIPEFSFVVLGDNQPPADNCSSPLATPELTAFPLAARSLSPDFVLHLGDLVDMGRVPGAYAEFERCYAPLLQAAPLFPTAGNHDLDWNLGAAAYRRYLGRQLLVTNPAVGGRGHRAAFPLAFQDDRTPYSEDPLHPTFDGGALPSGFTFKTYYAFRHRGALFISMEVTTRWEINTPLPWLEAQLKRARELPGVGHIFVFMHSPIYSTFKVEAGAGDTLQPVRQAYERLFRQYDVTMVFAGHAHAYDRMLVPDDGAATRASPPPRRYSHDGRAVHYLVVGPAGASYLPGNGCAPIPPPRPELSYSYLQARGCGHNMARVRVRGKQVEVQVLGVKGPATDYKLTEWDRFTLE